MKMFGVKMVTMQNKPWIDDITRKQISAIKTWEDEHPGCDNPELTDEYLHILKTIITNDDISKEQIHKHIGNESD